MTNLTVDGFSASTQTITVKQGDTVTFSEVTDSGGTEDGSSQDINIAADTDVTSASFEFLKAGTSSADMDLDVNGSAIATATLTGKGDNESYVNLISASALKTLNLAGATDLSVNTDSTVETISGADATGNLTLTGGFKADADVTLGAGDDKLVFGSAFSAKDKLDGGAGKDTLSISDTGAAASDATVSNFEVLELTGDGQTVDVDADFSGFSEFVFANNAGGSNSTALYKVDNATSGLTATLLTNDGDSTADDDIEIALAEDGSDDVVSLVVGDAETQVIADGLKANQAETVNIDVTAASATDATVAHALGIDGQAGVNFTDATSVVLTGAGNLTLEDVTLASEDHTFDASAATGDLDVDFINTGIDQTLTFGSGDDVISMKDISGADVIDGGAGDDSLTVAEATTLPSLLDTTNVETVVFNVANTPAAQTMDVRLTDGIEKLNVSGKTATDEDLTLSGVAAGTIVQFDTLTNDSAGDTHTVNYRSGVTEAEIQLDEFGHEDDDSHNLTVDNQITGLDISTEAINTVTAGDAFISTLSATGATSLDLEIGEGGDGIDIDTLTAGALTSLTLSKSNDETVGITIDSANTDSDLTSIDASGMTSDADGEGDVVLGDASNVIGRAGDAEITLGVGDDDLSFDITKHGNNVIDMGKNSSTTTSEDGDNLILAGSQTGDIVMDLSSTTDQMATLNGLANTAVQKNIESVDGSSVSVTSGKFSVTGSDDANTIKTSSGDDVVSGGGGADTITVGSGADVVTGGDGIDVIDVGSDSDADIIKYSSASESAVTSATDISESGDIISNFDDSDKIDLSGLGVTLTSILDKGDSVDVDSLTASDFFDDTGDKDIVVGSTSDLNGDESGNPDGGFVIVDVDQDGDLDTDDLVIRISGLANGDAIDSLSNDFIV